MAMHKETLFGALRALPLWLACGLLVEAPALAGVTWPGVSGGGGDQPSDYQQGWEDGQADCRTAPLSCGVSLDDMVKDLGAGETEPNDHLYNADGLLSGEFFHANTSGNQDVDYYFITSDRKSQRLSIYFLGDVGDYSNTGGWQVQVQDVRGNVIASFTTTPVTGPTIQGNPDASNDSAVASARLVHVTLGQPGTYYISVRSGGNSSSDSGSGSGGALRGYHIGVRLRDTGQITADYSQARYDTETEPNDDKAHADTLRSQVAMVGLFGRTLVRSVVVTTPASEEIAYVYKGCNPANLATLPPGQADCVCDMTKVSAGGNAYVDPPNPNIPDYTVGPPPLDCATDVDSASPHDACKRETACVAERVVTPATQEHRGIFDYDEDWFVYHSDGNEQLRFQICTRTECQFSQLHLRVEQGSGGSPYVVFDGPVTTTQLIDLGAVAAGDYYFHLSPEETGVNPQTGDSEVIPLIGSYDILLLGTGQKPGGGNQSTITTPPQKKPKQPPPPPPDGGNGDGDGSQTPDWLKDLLGG